MAQDVNIALNFPADIFLTSDEDPSRSESKKRGQENKVDLTNSKDIFELSDDNVGNAAFMDVDNEERNKPKDENKANLSQNIFLSDGEDVISNTSIDIFENCESCSCFDNDVAIKPIGDVVPKKPDTPEPSAPEPMEIDYDPQPGPSNLNKSIYIPYAQPPTSIYHAEQEEDILSDNIDISQDLLTDQNILNNAEVEEPPSKIPHLLNTTTEEVRLQKTLQKLREDTANEGRHFGRYMQLKKDKLRYQVNVISRVDTVVSNIFEGVSIFINGHTALELRELIQTHGGQYHCYMEYGITTYTIASSLASAKIDKSRKDEIFLLPGWIIDSIAAGERLAIDEYRLVEETKEKRAPITIFFGKRNETPAPPQREKTLDARDPNFIQEFYARSRLHLISTLAQDMKDFMMNLRETGNLTTEEWDKTNFPVAEISITGPIVFHIDMDSFFVSVALRNRPDLIDKPIAITHSKGSASAPGFSEVASVSYAARKLGLKNGMLIRDALKLCPKLVCLPYQFDAYREVSKQIYILVAKYTLEVRAVSCDEMYVNFSKICSERKIGDPIALANHIRGRIKEETGCPASVGIGHNMLLARLSTRKAKPDGVYWCRKKDSVKFVANEKLENIPGVGYHTMNKLKDRFGIVEHCGDLQNIHIDDLGDIFGKKSAEHLYKRCRGEDDSMQDFISSSERKSVSCDINYGIRFTKKEEATDFLKRVVEEVCKKLTSCRRLTGAVTLKLLIRSSDAPIETPKYLGCGRCDSITKTALLKKSSDDVQWIFKEILTLYDSVHPVTTDLRGVGIHCGRLVPADPGVRRLQVVKDFFVPNKAAAPRNRKLDVDEPRKTEKIETEVKVWMQMPKFRQCTTMAETKIELRSVLLEDPNKKHVKEVGRFLFHLQKYGAYDSLRKYIIYLGQLQSDRDIQDMWIEALEVWRHGDRAPLETYPLDPYQENAWTFGGSGWGQLSPLGMEQHLKLGKLVRERYITGNYTFLSNYYDSHEIYVRSTDVNRTIISALSNMAGMWSQPDYGNRQGLDLPAPGNPSDPIWPPGFVPIAVHTVDDDTDYIGNADAVCPRQDQLQAMSKSSDEVSTYLNSPSVVSLFQNLTANCGKTIDGDNLWVVTDSFLIEGIWQSDFRQKVTWYSDELNQQANIINDQIYLYQNGVYNKTLIMNGLDIGIEIKKIRGGSLANDILMHANLKTECWRNDTMPTDPKCKWINNLKYYVYSAHDETVYALFACLGIQSEVVLPHGYPKYSAATFFELWYDYEGHAPVFRLMYHDGDGSVPPIRVITDKIAGCYNQEFCPLSVFADIAATVKPDMPMDQWCLVDPRTQGQATSTPKAATILSTITGTLAIIAIGLGRV